jgi:hypothetical protein
MGNADQKGGNSSLTVQNKNKSQRNSWLIFLNLSAMLENLFIRSFRAYLSRIFLEDSGRDLAANMSMDHKYYIVIRGNTLSGMTEEALHFTYFFLSRALAQHRHQGKNGEYEAFAVGVLALLQQYRQMYTSLPDAPDPGSDNSHMS